MSKPIVIPTDFSEHSATALGWARRMADALDAPLHCIYVARDATMYSGTEFVPNAFPSLEEIKQSAGAEMKKFLAEHDLGNTHSAILQGTPFVEIIRYARDQDAAMIVMSTHGYSGLKHMLLGSTTEAVVRKATCPVMSVPAPGVWFEMP